MSRSISLLLILACGLLASTWILTGQRAPVASTFPGAQWERAPERSSDQASARRKSLRDTLAAGDTTGMLVIVGGRVLFEYGNTAEVSYIASARKSVVSMLYGKYVDTGVIKLMATLRDLRIDEKGGLLPAELDATVEDLLSARSGVYHPAANAGDASDRAPARGSVKHGTYFLYNNWDFNALETILEQRTGRKIYDIFSTDLATPLGLQDWNVTPGAYADAIRNDTGLSNFPAHHILLSTRDMARLGYLMLRHGRWRDHQLIPAEWVHHTTSTVTPADEVARTSPFIPGLGYGNLWWTLDGPPFKGTALEGAFTASGAYGQYITVVPQLDMVVAHKTAVPPARNVPNERYFNVILPAAAELARTSRDY